MNSTPEFVNVSLEVLERISQLESQVDLLYEIVRDMWHVICFMIALLNQMGFCFLEAGIVRAKHVRHILLTNLLDSIICTISWYLVGWGIAFGDGNGFTGTSDYLILDSHDYSFWLIQLIFALTAVTIPSGVMVERNRMVPYLVYVLFSSAFMYPFLAHWIWGPDGWLTAIGQNGVLDTAGGIVVHSYAGSVALCATLVLGPRMNRWNSENPPRPHNFPLLMLGTWFLLIAWTAFNMGASIVGQGSFNDIAKIGVNTLLGGFSAALSYFLIQISFPDKFSFEDISGCVLAGCSAMTSASGMVDLWYAFPIGVTATLLFLAFSRTIRYCKIDDPVEAVAVHLGGGMSGVVWIGLVSNPTSIGIFRDVDPASITQYGLFLGGGGEQLGIQLLGLVVAIAWAASWTLFIYFPLRFYGSLRVPNDIELSGLDNYNAGGSAYPDFKLT